MKLRYHVLTTKGEKNMSKRDATKLQKAIQAKIDSNSGLEGKNIDVEVIRSNEYLPDVVEGATEAMAESIIILAEQVEDALFHPELVAA